PVTSWRGFWLTLRAQVLVVTHGLGDVNRFGTRGGFIVQLWHGIPLKLIHLDSPATMRSPILPNSRLVRAVLRWLYRGASRAIDVMPAASELSAGRLRSAFALPAGRVVVTGDPRDDVLSRGTEAQRRQYARELVAQRLGRPDLAEHGARIILQAPTWRDGAVDPGIPTAAQWTAIATFLETHNSHLVIRPHPLSVGEYGVGPTVSPRIHLLGSALQSDITPVLPAFQLLVTDYSSIAYDYSLTGGDILYLAPDVVAYAASRGLYEPYSLFSGGFEVTDWDALLTQWARREGDVAFRETLNNHTRTLATRNHAFRDGRNTVRVYNEIVRRLKGTP
ncbi:MAG: glycosyl/glycerophosphate transferase, partial [Glaciihabitans sp.]|nr:glycosyl/glycerophosphate transferase [Glaciihabitans sp.]